MTMKYALFSCIAALAIMPGLAVQHADNYEASKALVQEDGYILFAFAEDWDTYSKRVCEKLMAADEVVKAAGNAVFMRVPIPNYMTEERKAADKERFGPLQVADAPNYPAILLLNKEGKHYATITGPFMRKAQPKVVAEKIRTCIAGYKKQAELLERANAAQGVEKARLLGEATLIPDINPPGRPANIYNQITKLDPNDESGYVHKLRDPWSFVGEIVGIERSKDADKGWEVAMKKVEEYLNDPAYTPEQQQVLHALAAGLLHRHGTVKDADEIRRHARAIHTLVPDNYLGKSGPIAERQWAMGFNLADGWSPGVVSQEKPVELEGPLPIGQPGTWVLTFNYERGNNACVIKAVSLYDGSKLVAEDRHNGSAGRNSTGNVYKLKVTAPLKAPHLFIEFDQKGSTNSFGHIGISRE